MLLAAAVVVAAVVAGNHDQAYSIAIYQFDDCSTSDDDSVSINSNRSDSKIEDLHRSFLHAYELSIQ